MKVMLRPAALAALLSIASGAFAQQPPAAPPRDPMAARADMAPAAPVATGKVQRWLLNPNGEVDGLLLADGTQVAFPPHLSASVLQVLKPGDTVSVSGWRTPNLPVVRALSLTATASGARVDDRPPRPLDPGTAPPAPPDRGALAAMSASGRIARLLYTDRGDVNGVVLDDGGIVRFPPHAAAAMSPALQVGGALHAKGWGSRTPLGSAIEATALGRSTEDMRELFAGPGNEPPPPRPHPRAGARPQPRDLPAVPPPLPAS